MLGEAGTGKSSEFLLQAKRLAEEGKFAFYIPLEVLAEEGVRRGVAPRETEFKEWLAGSDEAFFFLDAVDEARLKGLSLEKALRHLRHDIGRALGRSRVFVSCRWSDWRTGSDSAALDALLSMGGESEGGDPGAGEIQSAFIAQLAPLSADQIGILAELNGVGDVNAFLGALEDSDAFVFAQRPLDVGWLSEYWVRKRSLGSLSELIEYNIRQKLLERLKRKDILPVDQALDGALRLAGIGTLAKRYSIQLLSPGDQEAVGPGILDPRQVLGDWTVDEIARLLSLGAFDEAAYGLVRMHHRSVREYLAAKWLLRCLDDGLTRRALNDLLFRDTGNTTVVPNYLSSTAAWLAIWDSSTRSQLIELAPELLIEAGDQSRLSLEDKSAVLRAYCEKYADRDTSFHQFDKTSLRRFAGKGLSKTVVELLRRTDLGAEVRTLLMSLVLEGGIEEALPTAKSLALAADTESSLRTVSIQVVGSIGTLSDKRMLARLARVAGDLEPNLVGVLVEVLCPEVLGVVQLASLLRSLPHQPSNISTHLDFVLRDRLPKSLGEADRRLFLDSLFQLLGETIAGVPDDGSWPKPGRIWLFPALASLMRAEFEEIRSSDEIPSAIERGVVFIADSLKARRAEWLGLDGFMVAVAKCWPIKRTLFWKAVDAARSLGEPGTRFHESIEPFSLFDMGLEDLEWLKVDAIRCPNIKDRLIAFDSVLSLERSCSSDQSVGAHTKELAAANEAFGKRLRRVERASNKFAYEDRARRRRMRARELRIERQRAENGQVFVDQIEEIRGGTNLNLLTHLYRAGSRGGSSYANLSFERIAESYGEDVREAAMSGMRAIWAAADPPMPYEIQGRQTPFLVSIGLVGLSLEFRETGDLGSLERNLAERAMRFAIWELNSFPAWVSGIALSSPEVVQDVISAQIDHEYRRTGDDAEDCDVLRKLSMAETCVLDTCASKLKDLLRSTHMATLAVTEATLEALLALPALEFQDLPALARSACEASLGTPEAFSLWWLAWLQVSEDEAIDGLQSFLEPLQSEQAYALVLHICHRLWEWVERGSRIRLAIRRSVRGISRLAPIVNRHIRLEDDIWREGTYSPGPRDNAQVMRGQLIAWLAEIEGDESYAALVELANAATSPRTRDYRLFLAEERRIANVSSAASSVEDVIEWERSSIPEVRTSEDLFLVACNRLQDIKDFVEEGDFSYRELFTIGERLPRESVFQKWIAAELEQRSRRRYNVSRESESGRRKKPDIRVYNALSKGPISIELKVADRYSYSDFEEALKGQLIGQYMRAVNSRFGILLLCRVGVKKGKWRVPSAGLVDLNGVVDSLNKSARAICRRRKSLDGIMVVGIDFE